MFKKLSLLFIIFSLFFVLKIDNVFAAGTLTSVSDTVTTSRPSAASPLTANAASTTSLSILNNGSRYLASDSAKIVRTSTSADVTTSLTAASQSSSLLTVYFTGSTGSSGQAGTDVLVANQTAMHTITFTTTTSLPSGSTIVLTFPGSGSNTASPSATGFSFNGLTTANAAANISYRLVSGGAITCTTITVAAPTITCTTAGGSLSPGTITFLIGCADSSSNTTTCTTQSPRLINPIKSATAGTADIWTIGIKTNDGIDRDLGSARIGTDDSVQVQASVDSSFTFTIGGINNTTAINTGNTTGCTNTELSSSGFNASATSINLGSVPISSGVAPNLSAQLISITSNGSGGYTLTATSSGKLLDPSNGYSFPDDSSAPYSAFPATSPHFGIHACGLDVNTTNWGASGTTTTRGGTALYGWPTTTTAVTLATDATGPILGGSDGNGLTSVEYAVAGDASVPSGSYSTAINYVATPTF